jgi:hypothetical protein
VPHFSTLCSTRDALWLVASALTCPLEARATSV